jgi:hypothetical protein
MGRMGEKMISFDFFLPLVPIIKHKTFLTILRTLAKFPYVKHQIPSDEVGIWTCFTIPNVVMLSKEKYL